MLGWINQIDFNKNELPYINDSTREFQDKADIQFLIDSQEDLDWNLIKKYADLFNEWEVINEIKQKVKP